MINVVTTPPTPTTTMTTRNKRDEPKQLDVPVTFRDIDEHIQEQMMITMQGWTISPIDRKTYDSKKLEIAEKRLQRKQERRVQQERVNSELQDSSELFDDHVITVNVPTSGREIKDMGTDLSRLDRSPTSRRPDIRIENFDIGCHGKLLLVEANMFLVYGRKYGFVGRNGVGKSTLMKSLASRALPVPASISIIYVEQEVMADDTTALQSVLNADKRRVQLYEEQARYHSILQNTTSSNEARDKASHHLNLIFQEMEHSDMDKDIAM